MLTAKTPRRPATWMWSFAGISAAAGIFIAANVRWAQPISVLAPIYPLKVVPSDAIPPRVSDLVESFPVEVDWQLIEYREEYSKRTSVLLTDWESKYANDLASWVDIRLGSLQGDYVSDEDPKMLLSNGVAYQHRKFISKAIYARISAHPSGMLAVEYSTWIK